MVGKPLLYQMNRQLNRIFDIKDEDVLFGGIMVFFVGDLLQLPPVAAAKIYNRISTIGCGPEASLVNLWDDVRMLELREVMRTKGDPEWTDLLHRIRVWQYGDISQEQRKKDLEFLNQHKADPSNPALQNIMHVYPTNAMVNSFNEMKTEELLKQHKAKYGNDPRKLEGVEMQIKAKTTLAEAQVAKHFRGDAAALASPNVDNCGGLLAELHLVRGMRVALRRNVAVADRLANGSVGTVVGWHVNPINPNIPTNVFIKFDTPQGKPVGEATRATFIKETKNEKILADFKSMGDGVVPIPPFKAKFPSENGKVMLERTMIPISVAFASTIHRVQGATYDKLAIYLKGIRTSSMAYTALSRLTSSSGLFLLDFDATCLKTDFDAVVEMERLRLVSGLELKGWVNKEDLTEQGLKEKKAKPEAQDATKTKAKKRSTLLLDLDRKKRPPLRNLERTLNPSVRATEAPKLSPSTPVSTLPRRVRQLRTFTSTTVPSGKLHSPTSPRQLTLYT